MVWGGWEEERDLTDRCASEVGRPVQGGRFRSGNFCLTWRAWSRVWVLASSQAWTYALKGDLTPEQAHLTKDLRTRSVLLWIPNIYPDFLPFPNPVPYVILVQKTRLKPAEPGLSPQARSEGAVPVQLCSASSSPSLQRPQLNSFSPASSLLTSVPCSS